MLPENTTINKSQRVNRTKRKRTYELLFVDKQNGGICLEVDSVGLANDFKATNGDIRLISETQPDKMKHVVFDFHLYLHVQAALHSSVACNVK